MTRLLLVTLAILVINLPFGFWRAGLRKFSLAWIVAVHAPVPLVIAVRYLAGVDFRWDTAPFLIAAFFAGQFLGARFRR
ncbi:MAG TPA: hypothetical protein VLD67_01015 [Vicinamibacterales bacterium]|nr:hypothetical protein [Vicinamibacterales bacterium]